MIDKATAVLALSHNVFTCMRYYKHKKNAQERLASRGVFNDFDTDHDGEVTLNEFIARYQKIDPNTSTEQLKQLFKEADKDGSGTLSFNEFLKMGRKLKRVGSDSSRQRYSEFRIFLTRSRGPTFSCDGSLVSPFSCTFYDARV
jgi:hypothetical protein